MNRRQRARKLDKRRQHTMKNRGAEGRRAKVEEFIEQMPSMTKPVLCEHADSLKLTYTTKTTKPQLIDMIAHRLRDNVRHGITVSA